MDDCKAFYDRAVWTEISEEFSAISLKHIQYIYTNRIGNLMIFLVIYI